MSDIKLKTVLGWFWKYTRPTKGMFFGYTIVFAIAYSMEAIIPLYYKRFFNVVASSDGSPADRAPILLGIIGTVGLFMFVRWVLYRIAGILIMRQELIVKQSMDEGSFSRILDHSQSFFSDNFAGTLMRRVKRFSDAYERIVDSTMFAILPIVTSIGVCLIVLFLRDLRLGFGMSLSVVLIIGANAVFSKWKLKYDHVRSEQDSIVSGAITDSFSNSMNIKMFAREPFERDRFHDIRSNQTKAQIVSWNWSELSMAVQTFIMIFVEVGIMWISVLLWKEGRINIGDIVLVQSYIIVLFDRLWNIGRVFRQIFESFADAKEMVEIMELPIGVPDLKRASTLTVTNGEVTFSDVDFSYHQTRHVIKDLSLTIKSGERVALVGSSGAGKSTMVKLLLRFADTAGGRVLIDGQDIRKVTQESLRLNIAFVPQESILFHRTLGENIRYARLDATQEEIERSARLAHCHEFIEALPEKYETYVGERGVKLSGGERQRVAIARAILKNAPILVLDEATSSLDSESESLIQDALHTLMKGRTTIAIAHRLSTIMQMDRIIVLDGGTIVDEGTHVELLKRGGLYQRLWNIQAGGFA
jgi:ATP-binding cassette subfamily B protein